MATPLEELNTEVERITSGKATVENKREAVALMKKLSKEGDYPEGEYFDRIELFNKLEVFVHPEKAEDPW